MRIVFPAIVVILLLTSCGKSFYQSNENLYYLFNNKVDRFKTGLKIYDKPEEGLKLFVSFSLEEVALREEKTGKLKVGYKVLNNYEDPTVWDSGSLIYSVKKDTVPRGSISFDLHETYRNSNFLVVVEISDLNSKSRIKTFIYYDPQGIYSAWDYLVRKGAKKEILTGTFISSGEPIFVSDNKKTRTFGVKMFNSFRFEPAPPPYLERFKETELMSLGADSIFSHDAIEPFDPLPDELYFFQNEPNTGRGVAVLSKPGFYPRVKTAQQLRESLVYLMNSKEYKELLDSPDPKVAVDDFWLGITANKARARDLIHVYYRGVEEANHYFTSYKEGWKTDRGMIYIVFGNPPIVYRDNTGESWIYPETAVFPELTFRFFKVKNAFSDNHYQLIRSGVLEEFWDIAVNRWRNGEIRVD